jgi:hypothetical protein
MKQTWRQNQVAFLYPGFVLWGVRHCVDGWVFPEFLKSETSYLQGPKGPRTCFKFPKVRSPGRLKFCAMANSICGSSAWNPFQITHLLLLLLVLLLQRYNPLSTFASTIIFLHSRIPHLSNFCVVFSFFLSPSTIPAVIRFAFPFHQH